MILCVCTIEPFKRQIHKMVKHTQKIRRQFADELFECVWPFCEFGAERVKVHLSKSATTVF